MSLDHDLSAITSAMFVSYDYSCIQAIAVSVVKVYDKDLRGYTYTLEGGKTGRLQIPKDERPGGMRHILALLQSTEMTMYIKISCRLLHTQPAYCSGFWRFRCIYRPLHSLPWS